MFGRATITALILLLATPLAPTGVALASETRLAQAEPQPAADDEGDKPASLELPRRELRVATKVFKPFVFRDGKDWAGFSIDLWEAVALYLDLRFVWVETEDVQSLLAAVEPTGDCDVAIAGISMTRNRELHVDFSYPFFESGLQVMTSTEGASSTFITDTLLPVLLQVGGAGVLILLFVAHIIWLAERRRNTDMFPKAYLQGIWAGFWWSAVTLTTVGYGDTVPRSKSGRLVALVWMFSGIILISFFTATVTTGLTIEKLEGPIQGPHDLVGHSVGTVGGSTAERYLIDAGHNRKGYPTIEDAYAALINREVEAVVYDAPALRYDLRRQGSGSKLAIVGPMFERQSYAVALREGSPLREAVNRALLHLREDGTFESIYQRWFGADDM